MPDLAILSFVSQWVMRRGWFPSRDAVEKALVYSNYACLDPRQHNTDDPLDLHYNNYNL